MDDPAETFDTGLRPDDLDPEHPQSIETPWGAFFLVESGGRFVAVESWCPHMAGPLFQGSIRGERVTCPWHSWVFSLESGKCLWRPEGRASRGPRLRLAEATLGEGGTLLLSPPEE